VKYNEDGTLSAESKKEIISAIEKHGYDNVSNAALWGYAGPSDIGQDMLKTFGISGAETNRDFTMVHMYAFEYKHNKKEASHDAIIPDPIYPCVFAKTQKDFLNKWCVHFSEMLQNALGIN